MQLALKSLTSLLGIRMCVFTRYGVYEGIVLGKTWIDQNTQGADKPLSKADEHADCGSCPVR